MAQRVILIGGSGFIGERLTRRWLDAGAAVVIADRAPSATWPALFRRCDVTDIDSLTPLVADADWVYNLAAAHGDDVTPRSLYDEVNVGGAHNLCAAAEQAGVRQMVCISTVAVYGPAASELDETAAPAPVSDYGRSKLAAETVYRGWQARDPARRLAIVRPATVFGPGNRANIYRLLCAVADGSFRMIGGGNNRKSLAYVENLADFLQWLPAQIAAGETLVNYADKPDLSMNELVAAVRAALGRGARAGLHWPYGLGYAAARLCEFTAWLRGRQARVTVERLRKFSANTQYAARRAAALGFVPRVSLAEALRQTVTAEFGAPVKDGKTATE